MTNEELLDTLSVLERIANIYDHDSPEYRAVELSAKALLFSFSVEVVSAFDHFLQSERIQLTTDQLQHFREMMVEKG